MNKRLIIFASLVIIMFGVIIGFYIYNQSTDLTIHSTDHDFDIVLITNNSTTTVKPNQRTRLKKRQYKLQIVSDKYAATEQTINLTHSTTINLNLDYSQKFATKFFKPDREQLTTIIKNQHSSIKIHKILFYQRGQYAIVGIYKPSHLSSGNVQSRIRSYSSRPIFKIIFKKTNNQWQQLSQPELIFYHKNYNDIPKEILQLANDILTP